MSDSFSDTFTQFIQQYIDQSTPDNSGLLTEFDSDWLSPCLQINDTKPENGETVAWRPYKREPYANLENICSALDISLPQSFHLLFGQYYSLDLNATHARGPVCLLQAFNEQDFERLQKNLIAHVLMKRRLKQAETVFFALTDEDDFIISLQIDSQEVVLERVGKAAQETLSPSLEAFIAALKPAPQLVVL